MPAVRFRSKLVSLWLVALMSSIGVAGALPGLTGSASAGASNPNHVLLGAFRQPRDGSWSQTSVQASVAGLESDLGRPLDIDSHYDGWQDPFPGWREPWDLAGGRIPMISWGGTYTSDINSGSYDSMIAARAAGVKALGGQVLMRWFWEMDAQNADTQARVGTAADFIAAWRRIHDIFQREGATNAQFVWCPNAYWFSTGLSQSFYPGDAYVDWICADGYNWYPSRGSWTGFRDIFSSFYSWAAGRGKPLMVGETGAQEDPAVPGRKAQWIRDMTGALRNSYPAIRAVVYFDTTSTANFGGSYDWRVDTSPSSYDAFKALAADPLFSPDTIAPAAPAGVVATPTSATAASVSWAPASDNVAAVAYDVYRDGAAAGTTSATSFLDSSLKSGVTYRYTIRARDAAGNTSAESMAATATIPAPVVSTTTSTAIGSVGPAFSDGFEGGSMTSWTTANGLRDQQVERYSGSWSARGTSTGSSVAYSTKTLDRGYGDLYYRARVKVLSQGPNSLNLVKLSSTRNAPLALLYRSSNGTLMLFNSVANQARSSGIVLTAGAWHSLQIHVVVDGASSRIDVWLDGNVVGSLSGSTSLGMDPAGGVVLGDNLTGRSYDVAYDDVVASTAYVS